MYPISPLMSTPVSNKAGSSAPKESLSPEHDVPSYVYAFLDSDATYECCSINPLTGSLFTCRCSPRLLTNGYYVLTEDSFLSDDEGNVTLTPSQISITYKEKLVRIFRKRKKIRRSLASLFSLSASNSWLNSTVLGNMDSSHGEETWIDDDSHLDASQSYNNGHAKFSCKHKVWISERQSPATNEPSSSKEVKFLQSRKHQFYDSSSCSQFMVEEYFPKEALDIPKSFTVRNVLYQMIMLFMC
uniref:Transmembrane protein 71 n=1 Tax=Sphenodon punctatus TaxID=8508 RepID=A0A8D0GSZ5_SPHPU